MRYLKNPYTSIVSRSFDFKSHILQTIVNKMIDDLWKPCYARNVRNLSNNDEDNIILRIRTLWEENEDEIYRYCT